MTVDLRSLLATPELGLSLRRGSGALDRTVRWVVTTDLADPRRYLTGGELVLTGMMWRHDPGDAEPFVARIAAAGAVALAAGDPELPDVPDDLVAACERHDLPLFHVSADVSFGSITEYVVRRLSAGRSADLAAVLGRHRSLIEADRGLAGVLGLVADEAGLSCAVVTPTGRLVQGGTALSDADRQEVVAEAASGVPLPCRVETKSGRVCSVFGIGAPLDAGRLLLVDDDHTRWAPERRAVVDELVAMVALDVEGALRRTETGAELFRLLEDESDPGAVAARLRLAGLAEGAPLVVVLAAGADRELLPTVVAEAVAPAADGYLWAPYGAGVAAVARLAEPHPRLLADARDVAAAVGHRLPAGHRLTLGVSDPVTTFDALTGALAEARHAERVAALRTEPAAVVGTDELSTHVLLLASVPGDVRTAFRSRVLDPLLGYDKRHTSDLVRTLDVFLDAGCSWSRAAAELHVHVNTLRYRIERIEQLTGKDLRRLPDQVDLYLARHLH